MEHLHPDDAFEQLKNIYNALKKGGRYLCATPNRLTGPHDVSQFFDDVATGLHLQEYSATELIHLFGRVGFDGFVAFFRLGHRVIKCPIPVLLAYEFLLSLLPAQLRRKLVAWKVFGKILDVRLVAQK
jgi:hypothetical protein